MDELARIHTEHLGELEYVVQRDVPLPPFDLPGVAPMQAGIPGELLLALAELRPARPDSLAELARRGGEMGSLLIA